MKRIIALFLFMQTFRVVDAGLNGHKSLPFLKPDSKERKDFALFFAVDDYDQWNDLTNSVKQAEQIAGALTEFYEFDAEVVKNPSREMINRKLQHYQMKSFSNNSQLLIYFIGHGAIDNAGESFFVPKNGERVDHYNKTFLSYSDIQTKITNIPCNHILLTFDALKANHLKTVAEFKRNQRNRRSLPGLFLVDERLKHNSRLLLTTGEDEYSKSRDISIFSRQFLEAVKTLGQEDEDGIVTFEELLGFFEKIKPEPRFGELPGHQAGGDFLFIPTENYERGEEYEWYKKLDLLVDKRDEKRYHTIQDDPDGPVWMTENLNYEKSGSTCYESISQNCDETGRMYSWEEALIACPKGWRLPSEKDWEKQIFRHGSYFNEILNKEEGSGRNAYPMMKEYKKIRLGGYRDQFNKYKDKGNIGYYWTASEDPKDPDDFAVYFYFDDRRKEVAKNAFLKDVACYCRCVKN